MIFTIGYQGKDIDSFVNVLKLNNIQELLDVRDIPISRKKGFSKRWLSEILRNNGIEYIHVKELGDPKELRSKIQSKEISWEEFRQKFLRFLEQRIGIIQNIVNMNHTKNICLMCFEANYKQCHRSLIAEVIEERFSERVTHL